MSTDSVEPDGAPQPLDLAAAVTEIQSRRNREVAEQVPDWLIEAHLRSVLDPTTTTGLTKRIGKGKFFAVGLVGGAFLSVLGGFLMHPAAFLLPLWKLKRLLYFDREWRPRLLTVYVQLDGDDALVFEAIHDLGTRAVILNYDALEARDFENAYGTDAPTLGEIQEQVDRLSAEEVGAIALNLLSRGILRTDGERFWIAF